MKTRLACLLLLGLAACETEDSTAPAETEKKAAPKAKQAQAAAVEEAQVAYAYSPVGKRDPFYSYLAELKETGITEKVRRLEATEQYELDQYRLTGVVTGTSQPKAMVEDPDGKGHVVQVGSRLGKRSGTVTRITSEGLVVTEEFRAPTGEKVRLPIMVKLPQPELEIAAEQ